MADAPRVLGKKKIFFLLLKNLTLLGLPIGMLGLQSE
jgi:hypothetical protein